jgi:diguanylate cyclase (GGDEF)-like protein/PAS domain S-box-containing protein
MTVSVDERYYKGVAGMLDALPERVIRYRLPDLTVTYCNVAWAAGHNLEPADVIGHRLDDLLSTEEKAGLESQLSRLGPDNLLLADNVPRPAPNAPGQWVEWVDQYLPGPDGAEVLAVGRDVTGRHFAELNLAASEARFRDLADKSADVVWRFVMKPHPHFDYMSPSVESILGYPPSMFIDDLSQFLDILDDEGRALIIGALHGNPMPERHDFRYRSADGSIVIGEMQTTVIKGGLQGVSRDVTELRALQANLAALALRDPLTGLANRRLLDELLEAGLAHAERDGLTLAVAYIDLDGFKKVNDSHGHDAGDVVLCETARRLLSIVRTADVVARLGGDEFVIVYEPNQFGSEQFIARVNDVLAAPINISATTTVLCPASVGYADTRTAGRDPAALLAAADAAMYEAKRTRVA